MIGTSDGNMQRNVKVGATLLCAFMMGHVMQNTLQHTSVPSVNIQSLMHVSTADEHESDPAASGNPIAISNILQTSALQMKVTSYATSGSLRHVAYAPEFAIDLPISEMPNEVPVPVWTFQVD